MTEPLVIARAPELDPASDYLWLRERGLEHIAALGHQLWTDFNAHDPGITLLEQLCYALTELAHRVDFGIADLLAPPDAEPAAPERQGFFSAREALTMSPLSPRDYRKLLVDVPGVKNAWLMVRDHGCPGVKLYANCQDSALQYAPATKHPVSIKGLYDVLVEFDDLTDEGSLNSGKIKHRFSFAVGSETRTAVLELRLPAWQAIDNTLAALRAPGCALAPGAAIQVHWISGNKLDEANIDDADLPSALRSVLYATFSANVLRDASDASTLEVLAFTDVPLRVWFNTEAERKAMPLAALQLALEEVSSAGPLSRYISLLHAAEAALERVRASLHAHRNLGEDFCQIAGVACEDIAVCADIEVEASADVEEVIAEAQCRISEYMNPTLQFRALHELLDGGVAVDSIFEGPKLNHGFLRDDEVDHADLRTTLYTSDLWNLLMDIQGVVSIRNFSLVRYDAEGRPQPGAARWELPVTPGHQARFYVEASRLLVLKNGLPFLADKEEVNDILHIKRGQEQRGKWAAPELDLPVPRGTHREIEAYYPVQYQLPATYGVSRHGLPRSATRERLAEARQLQAYLLFFEQLLVDYLAQLRHVSDCFALDTTVSHTYFTRLLTDSEIAGVSELYAGLNATSLQDLAEDHATFLDRRNRLLDHMLARFAESFADYAIMVYQAAESKQAAKETLIAEKVAFLQAWPAMTHDRAKAVDYRRSSALCGGEPGNVPGLSTRVQRALGLAAEDDGVLVIEHLLLRPRLAGIDPLLPICLNGHCKLPGDRDPYSFRLTIVLAGESSQLQRGLPWRRYAEQAIRTEAPAHLLPRICWVSREQLAELQTLWCAYLSALQGNGSAGELSARLGQLLPAFIALKSVYPPAYLHDCQDGDDDNRVFLDQTVITAAPKP